MYLLFKVEVEYMQNRYVADVGDFGKYGLLKSLCTSDKTNNSPDLTLGVVWYLVPDESHNDDGMHTKYLNLNNYRYNLRNCDLHLYDELADIVHNKKRNVSNIQKSNILPPNTTFYDKTLTFDGMPSNGPKARDMRLDLRKKWVQDALEATSKCDMVFVDPDNGLEVKSAKRHHKRGPKYTFYDELLPYLQKKQSLVVYQHTNRMANADNQINMRFSQINEFLTERNNSAFALHYHRGTSRVFFVIPAKNHKNILLERAKQLCNGPWSNNFTLKTQV